MSDPNQPGGWGDGDAQQGDDFAATSMERPAFDFGVEGDAAPPPAQPGAPAAAPWAGEPSAPAEAAPPWANAPAAPPPPAEAAPAWANAPAAPPPPANDAPPWANAPAAPPPPAEAAPAWANAPAAPPPPANDAPPWAAGAASAPEPAPPPVVGGPATDGPAWASPASNDAPPWAGGAASAPEPAPWSGGPAEPAQASFGSTSALPAAGFDAPNPGGGNFAATALDRPAFDFDPKQAPTAQNWSAPAGAATPSAPSSPRAAPPSQARATGKPLPKSDLGLKLALGGLVALILVLVLAIVAGLIMQVGGSDTADGDETAEPAD